MTFYSDLLTLLNSQANSEYDGTIQECGNQSPYLLDLKTLLKIRANLIRGGSTLSFYTDLLTSIETEIETSYQGLLSEMGQGTPFNLSLPSLLELRSDLNASESGGGGGSGAVVQVKTLNLTTQYAQSITQSVWTPVSGMILSITPTSTSNKILVDIDWRGNSGLLFYGVSEFAIFRNSTLILPSGVEQSIGNQLGISVSERSDLTNPEFSLDYNSISYADTPNTTSPIDYKLAFRNRNDNSILYTNTNSSFPNQYALISTIRLTEVTP